jgi:hypothetical protein
MTGKRRRRRRRRRRHSRGDRSRPCRAGPSWGDARAMSGNRHARCRHRPSRRRRSVKGTPSDSRRGVVNSLKVIRDSRLPAGRFRESRLHMSGKAIPPHRRRQLADNWRTRRAARRSPRRGVAGGPIAAAAPLQSSKRRAADGPDGVTSPPFDAGWRSTRRAVGATGAAGGGHEDERTVRTTTCPRAVGDLSAGRRTLIASTAHLPCGRPAGRSRT